MAGFRHVRLMLTPRAEDYIDKLKQDTALNDPIVQIGWGRWDHETEDHWQLGLNERSNVSGAAWHGIAPEFEFFVLHPALFDRLEGCILDITEGTPKVSDDAT